jgi:hypothetical protein
MRTRGPTHDAGTSCPDCFDLFSGFAARATDIPVGLYFLEPTLFVSDGFRSRLLLDLENFHPHDNGCSAAHGQLKFDLDQRNLP